MSLLAPSSLALDQEALTSRQAQSFGLDELGEMGEEYTGQGEVSGSLDIGQSIAYFLQKGQAAAGSALKSSLRSCVLLLAITLLLSLAEGMEAGAGGVGGFSVTTLAAVLSLTSVAVGDVNSLLTQGEDAIFQMETLADVLLPAVSMATTASGAPAAGAARYGITILFSDFLIRLMDRILIPLCYGFVAANVAWAALGNDGLKRVGGLLKWLIATCLSAVLLVFIGYLHLSGVIAGGADAATVKAAKFTISNLVPVVGGVISDTAETLLVGAGILRNAAGVFGMLAVVGICVVPFCSLGLHYLLYRFTAALAATLSGNQRVTGLIEAIGTAFGLILAMAGSCAMLLIVAMVSAVSSVT
jgi:stage III sporulation protein AE